MDFYELNARAHVIIGSIAFLGGAVALFSKKGSKMHRASGSLFVLGMLYAALSTIVFMMEEFLPLAVLMSLATVYLLFSALSALHHNNRFTRAIDASLIILPVILFTFAFMQFIRILPVFSVGTLARLLFAVTFAILIYRDVRLIRNRPADHLFYIRRHAFRMILAFGFAVMAVVRIGIKIDLLGLEFATFFPLLLALIAASYAERNIAAQSR